ncbi:MAG: hypothetical protein EWV53_11315 [Microcystis panniformis Mp_MB_F_20051200_S9]|uniref:SpoVT-AbrB domain-containing protein n=1 Tax=Microcystis panniformis Mp_MB_F_20051200_S9 TaxID=2486223 RepID=A0A552PYD6_9CHRO|nr:MAG: hypothetical protein EWV53_11315 [Microcystis panniformis Mp_MB_F_20051200_S9]
MKLKICKIGNSLGASFPKEVLDKLQVGEGDTIYVTETPDGVQLTIAIANQCWTGVISAIQSL